MMRIKQGLIAALSLSLCLAMTSIRVSADWATIGDNRVYIEDNKMVKEWKKSTAAGIISKRIMVI